MIERISHFFWMNGYGWYVWLSYGSVCIFLIVTWLIPFKRWKKYLRTQKKT